MQQDGGKVSCWLWTSRNLSKTHSTGWRSTSLHAHRGFFHSPLGVRLSPFFPPPQITSFWQTNYDQSLREDAWERRGKERREGNREIKEPGPLVPHAARLPCRENSKTHFKRTKVHGCTHTCSALTAPWRYSLEVKDLHPMDCSRLQKDALKGWQTLRRQA